ncbi:MAG: hypothetical protein IJJ14_02670 [Coriobacteriales bacterium]|nr:hypothetical protein [Coriobacteriales bacterium]MBQ6586139.1 hypothetical protein [Coriobacteriales bacterium]
MSYGDVNCLICGAPLVYFEEARELVCESCGKTSLAWCACENGHYICDACHRSSGVRTAMELCKRSDSKDPIEIAMEIMDQAVIYPNGPEHHTLVGAALLTAYRNSGGGIDLDAALAELEARSLQVPGGTCGFWGTCGAAVSAGMYWSIITGASPMTVDTWGQTQRLTSRILGKLADIGGPRCCKRTGFTAIREAAAYTQEMLGVQMDMPQRIRCHYHHRNYECLKEHCPYYPLKG